MSKVVVLLKDRIEKGNEAVKKEVKDESFRKIKVTKLPEETTEEILMNYFENRRRNGGGPIVTIEYYPATSSAIIEFEEAEDVVRVLQKRPLLFLKKQISVEEYIEEGEKEPPCCTIEVRGFTETAVLEMYFGDNKQSGGGKVTSVKITDGVALVTFADQDVCEQVLQRKHKIDGRELQVSMHYEYQGRISENDTGPSFKPPKSVNLAGLEFAKMQFLMKSEPNRTALEKQLQDCFTQIQWPQTETDCTTLTCTLTSDVQDCRKKALTWAKQAEQNLHDFLKVISVHELRVFQDVFETVLQNLQDIVISNPDGVVLFVKKAEFYIQVVGLKAVATVVAKDIEGIIKKAEADFDRKKKQTKESVTNLKYHQLKLLLAQKYPSKMEQKFNGLKVKIILNRKEIVFEGLTEDIWSAQVAMHKAVHNSIGSRLKNIPEGCLLLYKSKEVKDYIVGKLKSKKLVGVWEAKGTNLFIYANSDEDLVEIGPIINGSVKEHQKDLETCHRSVVQSQQWNDMVKDLDKQYQGKLRIILAQELSKLFLYFTDDISGAVIKEVDDFLSQNTILENLVISKSGITRLIERSKRDELDKIAKDLAHNYVQIAIQLDVGFLIQGNQSGINQAIVTLQELIGKVQHREHELQKPGVAGYMEGKGKEHIVTVEKQVPCVIQTREQEQFGSEENEEEMDSFEAVSPEDIATEDQDEFPEKKKKKQEGQGGTGGEMSENKKPLMPKIPGKILSNESSVDGKISITVVKGNMADEIVDVIVNTTSYSLDLTNGSVSKSLLKKGGQTLQDECKKKYPNGIDDGDIAVTGGGNLGCQIVCHGALKSWDDETINKNILHGLMKKCLDQCEKDGFTSIAFPALGTGVLNYPRHIVAKEMFQNIYSYSRDNPSSSITEVRFVVYENDLPTVKAFELEQQKWSSSGTTVGTQDSCYSLTAEDSSRPGNEHQVSNKVPSKSPQLRKAVVPINTVWIDVYAWEKRDLDDAISKLNYLLDNDFSAEPVIKKFTLDQKKQSSVEESEEEEEKNPPSHTIEVHGFTEAVSEEVLEMYFGNSKQSGGGDISGIEITDGVALITFADKDIAHKVVSHGLHKVEGQTLEVKLYIPPPSTPTYEDRDKIGQAPCDFHYDRESSDWRIEIHEIFLDVFCKERMEEFLSMKRNDFVMENLLQVILANNNKEALCIMMACISKKWKEDFGDNTITVWLGMDYRGGKTGEEVLVCFHSADIVSKFSKFLGLPMIYRRFDETEMEPLENRLQDKYQRVSFNKDDAATIKSLICEHGEHLFKIHSNLEAISASSIKSRKHGIIEQTSILLYCRLKGVIPYGEDFFPKKLRLDEKCYPTDVREGLFSLGMNPAQRQPSNPHPHFFNNPLRMGCSIGALGSPFAGTLGPFVRLNTNDIGFLTCAHVLGINSSLTQTSVVQPADSESGLSDGTRTCGTFIKEKFDPSAKIGVDAALVCIDQKNRNVDPAGFVWIGSHQLLSTGFSGIKLPSFEDGMVIINPEFEQLAEKRVYKFGRTTGLTQGLFLLDGAMLKVHDASLSLPQGMPTPHGHSSNSFIMKGQFLVQKVGNDQFFSSGDSGAGVYVVKRKRGENKLALVGIAIGSISSGECVMTPIGSVLEALGLKESNIITEAGMETDQ